MIVIDKLNLATDWSAFNTDCTLLTETTGSPFNSACLSFSKANGAANTVYSLIVRTPTSMNLAPNGYINPYSVIGFSCYVSATTNLANTVIRLGTDASNYTEWRYADSSVTAARWNFAYTKISDGYSTGTGCNFSDIDYIALGFQYDAEGDALAGQLVSQLVLIPPTEHNV